MRLWLLYFCRGTVVGVAVNFIHCSYFLLESGCHLLGLILGDNVVLVGGVAGTEEHFWFCKRILLSFLARRRCMQPRLQVCWA